MSRLLLNANLLGRSQSGDGSQLLLKLLAKDCELFVTLFLGLSLKFLGLFLVLNPELTIDVDFTLLG